MLQPAYDLSFYEFDEEQDPKSYGVLLCDLVHGKPPFKPLYLSAGWYWLYHGIRYAAELLHLPTTHGWDSRLINGYPYITAIATTEEEAKERGPIFREKIKPFIENFNAVYQPTKEEMLNMYKQAKESRGLVEWEDIKKLSNIELLQFFNDFVFNIYRRQSESHMMAMIPAFYISGLFQQMWHELFGTEAPIDPLFQKLMSGFDSELYKTDKKIWKLSRRAVELGLKNTFQNTSDNERIMKALGESEAGKKWLEEYYEFLKVYGWRCERMQEFYTPAWLEKPSQGIPSIKVSMLKETYTLDEELKRHIKEREEAEKEIATKVPVEQREWFRSLMKAAQNAGYWSEDHTYYFEFYAGAMGRWITREYGRRFAEAGCIDDPEDVYFLLPDDIRKAAIPMGRVNLRPYVERRKKAWEESVRTEQPTPFFGDISRAGEILMNDPTLSVSTQNPIVREELKADLYGAAAAPGFVEGTARVIMSVDKLAELKEGEILVAPGTSASWTPAFNIIGGLITDGGGALSHPIIVAREYSIPCVAGCLEATSKIKTGQRVRVDGNLGVAYILD